MSVLTATCGCVVDKGGKGVALIKFCPLHRASPRTRHIIVTVGEKTRLTTTGDDEGGDHYVAGLAEYVESPDEGTCTDVFKVEKGPMSFREALRVALEVNKPKRVRAEVGR